MILVIVIVFYLAFAATTGVYGQQDHQEKNSDDTGGVGAVCQYQEVDCVDDDGSCVNTNGFEPKDLPGSYCTSISGFGGSGETGTSSSSSFDLYRFGGSAQAYTPGASTSSVVCDPEVAKTTKYKASAWPLTRRTTSHGRAPTIDVELKFWTCSPKSQKGSDVCSCYPFQQGSRDDVRVEVWQTRPDGTYFTLNNGSDGSSADECRATVPVSMGPGTAAVTTTASFSTVAPGSTGVMGGLGPSNWESYPYGRPVIHILVNSPSYQTLLLDVPVLFVPKTLEHRDFSLKSLDWSGRGWSLRNQPDSNMPYNITSWNADIAKNHIDIAIDLYLEKRQTENVGGDSKISSTAADLFCRSSISSFTPTAFFVEPIAVCRRYLLDFLSV
eukprot:CAMPEP_0113495946 /NCGR_PEP_ID=MMETSP0014_2-20120614/29868_1 /TAXON_ID=2857 /ORGANISM="Nitzschia sp." /LENGTH=383 /DNA_ID=CAMNT_0000389853 /DNA_START=1 /DNA_END=1152 /DNA_ORIENTATION=- /assembly_acc=CAM_ASM_000159